MLTTVTLLALALAPGQPLTSLNARTLAQDSAADDLKMVSHDLAGLSFAEQQGGGQVLLPSLRWSENDEEEFTEGRISGVSHFVGLIESLYGAGLSAEGCRATYTPDGRLLVVGPAQLQADIANTIEFFRSVSAASAELTLDFAVIPGSVEVPSLIDIDQVPGLLEAASRHSSHVLQVSTGKSASIAAGWRRYLVLDFDVEIAQGTVILDPLMGDFFEGFSATVSAAPCEGGLLLGLIAKRGARLDQTPDKELGMRALLGGEHGAEFTDLSASVQSPASANRSCAFSAMLPTGKALVVTTRAGASDGTELMILRQSGGQLSPWSEYDLGQGERLVFADPACALAPRVVASGRGLLAGGPSGLIPIHSDPRLSVDFAQVGAGLVKESMLANPRTSNVDEMGPWLVLWPRPGSRGGDSAGSHETQRARFDSLRASSKQYEVELRLRTPDGDTGSLVRLPLREGTSASVVLGVERLMVRDYDVEVAGNSATPDPTIAASFEGLALWIQVLDSTRDQLQLKVRGAVSYPGATESGSVQTPFFTYLDQADERDLTLREHVHLTPTNGRWQTLLGDATGGVSVQVLVRPL